VTLKSFLLDKCFYKYEEFFTSAYQWGIKVIHHGILNQTTHFTANYVSVFYFIVYILVIFWSANLYLDYYHCKLFYVVINSYFYYCKFQCMNSF
jgi:hypothetical protein